MKRPSSERVLRMLSVIPWVAGKSDGVPIGEICSRFGVDRARLLDDLGTVSMVGIAPFTADVMVEVILDDDRVRVTLPQAFTRPLRMSPDQGLALLARTQGLLGVAGVDPEGPLARGLAKLSEVIGVELDTTMAVELGEAEPETLSRLQDAIRSRHRVELDYYSYGRDAHTHRRVDPYRLYGDRGQWYLEGYCHLGEAERLFRVDRISGPVVLDESFEPPSTTTEGGVFRPSSDDPVITIELARSAAWVVEQYPVDRVAEADEGRLRVTMTVASPAWLERLLLALGPDASVLDGPEEFRDAAATAAARVIERYPLG